MVVIMQKQLTPRFRLFIVMDTVTIEPVVIRPASSSSSRTAKQNMSNLKCGRQEKTLKTLQCYCQNNVKIVKIGLISLLVFLHLTKQTCVANLRKATDVMIL